MPPYLYRALTYPPLCKLISFPSPPSKRTRVYHAPPETTRSTSWKDNNNGLSTLLSPPIYDYPALTPGQTLNNVYAALFINGITLVNTLFRGRKAVVSRNVRSPRCCNQDFSDNDIGSDGSQHSRLRGKVIFDLWIFFFLFFFIVISCIVDIDIG